MHLRSGSKTSDRLESRKEKTEKRQTKHRSKESRNDETSCNKSSRSNKYLKALGVILFVLYVLIPVIVRTNTWIMSRVVFLPMFRPDMFKDLSKPETYGLNSTRNFYIDDHGVKLGAWHVLPQSLAEQVANEEQHIASLQDGKPIILYLHGQSGTRGSGHRVPLYTILSILELHIITMDYRGYADSEGPFPCEPGLIRDGKAAYKWIKERSKNTPIYLWGHSLGAGVATQLAKQLCNEGDAPTGMILESPFNNLRDAASRHPLGLLWWIFPLFEWVFIDPIEESDIHFQSDKHISAVTCPIVILHAEDDYMVPYDLGEKLYKKGLSSRPKDSGKIKLVSFDKSEGLGHRNVYKASNLQAVIRQFLAETLPQN